MQAKSGNFGPCDREMLNVCNDLCYMRALVTTESTNTYRKWSSHSNNDYKTSGALRGSD